VLQFEKTHFYYNIVIFEYFPPLQFKFSLELKELLVLNRSVLSRYTVYSGPSANLAEPWSVEIEASVGIFVLDPWVVDAYPWHVHRTALLP